MKDVMVVIEGNEYTLSSLQADVNAARDKGYGYRYAFTLQTVQGLIDKINELSGASKKFTKAELMNGDELVYRGDKDNHRWYQSGLIVTLDLMACGVIDNYTENFKKYGCTGNSPLDIVKVIRNGVTLFAEE